MHGAQSVKSAEADMIKAKLSAYRLAFDQYNTAGNGAIDISLAGDVVVATGKNLTATEIQQLVALLSEDKSGQFDFDEFAAVMERHGNTQKPIQMFEMVCLTCSKMFTSPIGHIRTCGACVKKTGATTHQCMGCHALFIPKSGCGKQCMRCRTPESSIQGSNPSAARSRVLNAALDRGSLEALAKPTRSDVSVTSSFFSIPSFMNRLAHLQHSP